MMISGDDFLLRIECTHRYLEWLELAHTHSWQELFDSSENREIPLDLVLCHPGWLEGVVNPSGKLGLGSFENKLGEEPCQSDLLWGYKCPMGGSKVQQDHLFPSSLGGPAVNTNHVWLCPLHNRWKSSDLSPFPWERGRPSWLSDQLGRMKSLLVSDLPLTTEE